jgi:outer membrane protein TolC
MLDVAAAYYDAALAERLLAISQATLAQADTTLQQVRVARQVGEQPEFELLRAQVTRDTQEPLVIQRRATRDIAQLRLRQLLELPLDAPLNLITALDDVDAGGVVRVAAELLDVEPDTAVATRAPVRQAEQTVRTQEAQVTVARAQRLPAVSLSSNWSRVAYPESGLPSSWNDFRTNWSIAASLSIPVFTGGRIRGDEMVARAGLEEARARLSQTRELAALDTRNAQEELRAAEATWRASSGTVGQAEKAYQIADIRFREGLSTQLELTDSRILLQQAQANRAQAARDLLVARLRIALLPLLPLETEAATNTTTPTPTSPTQQRQTQPQNTGGRTGVTATQTSGRQ